MSELYGAGYDNVDDAAAAALLAAQYQPRAANQEYMTLIVKDPLTGKIKREALQTDGQEGSSSWTGTPHGQVMGIAHTHPAYRRMTRYPGTDFSPTDVNTARQLGVPAYLSHMQQPGEAGLDRMYDPKGNKSKATGNAPGQEFLALYPWDEMRNVIMKRMGRLPTDPRGPYLGNQQQIADAIRQRVIR